MFIIASCADLKHRPNSIGFYKRMFLHAISIRIIVPCYYQAYFWKRPWIVILIQIWGVENKLQSTYQLVYSRLVLLMIPISMIALKNGLSNGIWSRENILVCIFSSLQNVKQWNFALMFWENEHTSSIFSLCMNGIAISTTHVCKVELDSEGFNIHEGLWTPHSKGTLSTLTWALSQHLWVECSCYFENVTLFKLSRITKKNGFKSSMQERQNNI